MMGLGKWWDFLIFGYFLDKFHHQDLLFFFPIAPLWIFTTTLGIEDHHPRSLWTLRGAGACGFRECWTPQWGGVGRLEGGLKKTPIIWPFIGRLCGVTLQGTNISLTKAILKMIFLLLRWDMLISRRVWLITSFFPNTWRIIPWRT